MFDFFFAHSWDGGVHERVVRIARHVQRAGRRVWIDADQLQPGYDVMRAMADGVTRSDRFVVFMTKSYVDKVNEGTGNVAREFTLAACMQKRTVVVLMDDAMRTASMRPGGVFSLVVGDAMYIDATCEGDASVARRIAALVHARAPPRLKMRTLSRKTLTTVIHV